MFTIMLSILPPLSSFLTSQPFATPDGNPKAVAGPCFGFYKFEPKQELSQLSQEIQDAIAGYASSPTLQAELKSVQQAIGRLQDVNKF
jgi:hypothetical protein